MKTDRTLPVWLVASCIVSLVLSGCGSMDQLRNRKSVADLGGDRLNLPDRETDDARFNRESASVAWTDSWEEAVQRAEQEGKPILACFTGSDWCTYCKKLEAEVFNTEEFSGWAAERVILLKLDFPQKPRLPAEVAKQNEGLKARYSDRVSSFPTVLFLSSTGAVLSRVGYVPGGPKAWIRKAESGFTGTP